MCSTVVPFPSIPALLFPPTEQLIVQTKKECTEPGIPIGKKEGAREIKITHVRA